MIFTERTAAWASLVPGLALSAAIAPKDAWFLPNFLFYGASQLAVLGVIAAFRSRPAVAAGSALALAVYLAGYAWWIFTRKPPDSMAWLGYLFTLPGALLPIAGTVAWMRGRTGTPAAAVAGFAAAAALAGLAVAQALACSRVMYCGA
jgi:hypothetical protein